MFSSVLVLYRNTQKLRFLLSEYLEYGGNSFGNRDGRITKVNELVLILKDRKQANKAQLLQRKNAKSYNREMCWVGAQRGGPLDQPEQVKESFLRDDLRLMAYLWGTLCCFHMPGLFSPSH
jgi:hypothetical protein